MPPHENNLRKQQSTTEIVYTFFFGTVVYKSKTQLLSAGS